MASRMMSCSIVILVLVCVLPACLGQVTNADCSASTNPPSACDTPTSYRVCNFNPTTGVLQLDAASPTSTACAVPQMCFRGLVSADVASRPATPCAAPPPACTTTGFFPHRAGGCSSFYKCVNNGASLKQFISTCDTGYEFSEFTSRCELTATAGCSVPTTTPAPTTPPPTTPAPTTPPPTTPAATPAVTTPTTPRPRCFWGQRFPDATNCRQFYVCDISGNLVVRQCPFTWRFDSTLLICRLNANCPASRAASVDEE